MGAYHNLLISSSPLFGRDDMASSGRVHSPSIVMLIQRNAGALFLALRVHARLACRLADIPLLLRALAVCAPARRGGEPTEPVQRDVQSHVAPVRQLSAYMQTSTYNPSHAHTTLIFVHLPIYTLVAYAFTRTFAIFQHGQSVRLQLQQYSTYILLR